MSIEREVQVTEIWLKTGEKSYKKMTVSVEMLQDLFNKIEEMRKEDPDCGAEITFTASDGTKVKGTDILVDMLPGNFPIGLS